MDTTIVDPTLCPDDKKDTWSEQMCIELIQAYRRHPVLYDPRDPYFYKRYAKISAWTAIGETLQRPPTECKHKMNILLSSFRRQKCKFRKGNMNVSKWFGYQHLKFLLLINKDEHSMYRMLSHDSDDTEDNSKSVISTEDFDERLPREPLSEDNNEIETLVVTEDGFIKREIDTDVEDLDVDANSEKEPSMPRNLMTEPQPENIPIQMEVPGPSQQPQMLSKSELLREAEIHAFANFVQTKMRKYTNKQVTAVQREILEILFKADAEVYRKQAFLDIN
ncbi:uncharacterized protein [Epargyreus clarus]|uniref:uncharacterized protein n=1 Tax=Epargyreus clarus TaxID=520877 RepID=UPI003C2D2E9C